MRKECPESIRYYDPIRNWRKIEPHLQDSKVTRVLVRDFNVYTLVRNRKPFVEGSLPSQFDFADWKRDRRGRRPRYWQYVCYGACHWLVNFNLLLAELVQPERDWRIITSDAHSSVWDGNDVLFDLNFYALQVPAAEGFRLAYGRELKVGKHRKVKPPILRWSPS